jgi:hypothetical protein
MKPLRLLPAALVVLLALVLRLDCAPREGRDLKPRPDALEYALGAASLLEHGRYALEIEGARYPPRYPLGASLALLPAVATCGLDGAWLAALGYGLLAVGLVVLLGHLAGGVPGAVVAGLVMAASPGSIVAATLAMSEAPSQALIAVALVALCLVEWRADGRKRRAALAVAALAIGAAVAIRYTSLAFAPLLCLAAVRRGGDGNRGGGVAALLAAIPFLVLVALLLHNQARFSHPLHDGYRFWVPELYANADLLFSPRWIHEAAPGLWEHGHLAAYGGALLGDGESLWTPFAAGLALLGLLRSFALARRCAVARTLLLGALIALPAIFTFHLVYAWQDVRFLLPLLPLLAGLAGSGAALVAAMVSKPLGLLHSRVANLVLAAALAIPLWLQASDAIERRAEAADVALPALLDVLPGIGAAIAPGAVCVIDFPTLLARRHLPRDVELWLHDLETADPHLGRIARLGLLGEGGARPEIRAVARGAAIDPAALSALAAAAKAGRTVLSFATIGEGLPRIDPRQPLDDLVWRRRDDLSRPPLTIHELVAPDG